MQKVDNSEATIENVASETYQRIIDAEPGENVVYWEGELYHACEGLAKDQRNKARGARLGALRAFNARICALVQKRLTRPTAETKAGTFAYIAQRNGRWAAE